MMDQPLTPSPSDVGGYRPQTSAGQPRGSRPTPMPESRQFAEARERFALAIRRTKGRGIARDLDLEAVAGFEANRLVAESFLDACDLPTHDKAGIPVSRDTLHALALAVVPDGDTSGVLLMEVEEGMVVNTLRMTVAELQSLVEQERNPQSPVTFVVTRPASGQVDRTAEATRLVKELYGASRPSRLDIEVP